MFYILFIAGALAGLALHRIIAGRNAPPATYRITYRGTYSQAFQRALDSLSALDARMLEADGDRGRLGAKLPATAVPPCPAGTLHVVITTQEGLQRLDVEGVSVLPTILRSGGRLAVHRFVAAWEAAAAPPAPPGAEV